MRLHEQFEVFTCEFSITTPRGTQVQTIEAPRMMLEQQFISLVEQAAGSNEPVKIKIKRNIPIYSQFEQKWLTRENSIEFSNNAYSHQYGEAI